MVGIIKLRFKQKIRKSKVSVITIPQRIMEVGNLNVGDLVKISIEVKNATKSN